MPMLYADFVVQNRQKIMASHILRFLLHYFVETLHHLHQVKTICFCG